VAVAEDAAAGTEVDAAVAANHPNTAGPMETVPTPAPTVRPRPKATSVTPHMQTSKVAAPITATGSDDRGQ